MIGTIINILQKDNFYGQTENIEIFKGKYELETSFKDVFIKAKRNLKWRLRK